MRDRASRQAMRSASVVAHSTDPGRVRTAPAACDAAGLIGRLVRERLGSELHRAYRAIAIAPRRETRFAAWCRDEGRARSARFYGGGLRVCSDVGVKREPDASHMLGRAEIGLAAAGLTVL